MITVQILKCKGCGANLSPSISKCEYCQSENIITTKENPFKLDKKISKQYSNYYKSKAKENPSDVEALFSVGLFYLKMKLYDLAATNFENAIKIEPDNADLYYYYSLSLIKGRRIKTLKFPEIKKVEEYLNTALQLDDKEVFYYLSGLIKQDYYNSNGLLNRGKSLQELLTEAKECQSDPEETEVLFDNIIIPEDVKSLF